ncbi:MAG TPA: phosphoenolpyruvate--protein phosphotransferase [Gemmatimonadaceae bacterium]|jgi:phosphotransferase system enzyme I (PtsI)|nr:phosphoenolpyruvate--protein phosphotransferase [Gemmatimonadaceae bacterium]
MAKGIAGMPASPGIVDGLVHLLKWEVPDVRHRIIPDEAIPGEIMRFHEGLAQARERLNHVRARAEKHAGPEEAAIFDVQLSILEDGELLRQVEELITQNLGAEKAFDLVLFEWRQQFASHARPLLRERVGDLIDVHIRVLSILLGLPDHDPVDLPKGSNRILVTHDLTPSLTVQLDREAIIGIATDAGTRTSHVAILARSLGLPAVVGLRDATERLVGNEHVILDGTSGILIVDPTPSQVKTYRERRATEALEDKELQALSVADSVTLDNHWVTLRANVDLPEEAGFAARSGAEGVGLMRTEFLVVGRATMPDEEEQYRAYRHVVEAFGGRPVVIRTFDVGGDKLPIGSYPTDPNPFLGWRAIRMCLDEPELFKTQLRALLRAAMHGDVRIMFPLIITLDEVLQAKGLLNEAARELDARGVPYRHDLPLGVMVETPAAALSVHTLVDDVSFLSIGTNDLVQYTLAVDRGSANLASRFTPLHPAVLTLIKRIVDVGVAHRLEVAVCGEMASQPLMAFALIGLGVRCLSVAGRAVPLVKRIVRGVSVAVAAEAANAALESRTAREAEGELRRRLMTAFGDAPFLRDGLPTFEEGNIFEGSGGLKTSSAHE